jgi:hypothetical protein
VDLFRAATWQPSVVLTIAEQIRLHGLEGADKTTDELVVAATTLFQALLDQASAHRVRATGLRLTQVGMTRDDWLAVVGVGETTRVHLRLSRDASGSPWCNLTNDDRKNGYPKPVKDKAGNVIARRQDTGDGTVPYEAAVPPFLGVENLVCLCDSDFGYWELRDRVLERGIGGKHVSLHSLLPAMNVVEKLVVCHLKGEAGMPAASHRGVWGRRAPDLEAKDAWRPPLTGLKERP